MRILTTDEFLKEPEGVIYCQADDLSIKGLVIKEKDFDFMVLAMQADNLGHVMEDLYDKDISEIKGLFLVFELPDLIRIRNHVEKAIELEKNKCS